SSDLKKGAKSPFPYCCDLRRHIGGCHVFHFFHRQLDAATLIDVKYLDLDLLTFLQVVGHTLHALVGDLRNVYQTILARQYRHEGAEVDDARYHAVVDSADFRFRGDTQHALHGSIGRRFVDTVNTHGAVIVDVDLGLRLFADTANGGTALADQVADLV